MNGEISIAGGKMRDSTVGDEATAGKSAANRLIGRKSETVWTTSEII